MTKVVMYEQKEISALKHSLNYIIDMLEIDTECDNVQQLNNSILWTISKLEDLVEAYCEDIL